MNTIAERVRFLVDKHYGGRVNRAAKTMGLAQQTLARIVSGGVRNPRMETLEVIARRHPDAPLEWLVLGKGDGPATISAIPLQAEALKWTDVVISLNLRDDVREAMYQLPSGIIGAGIHWAFHKQGRGTKTPLKGHPGVNVEVKMPRKILEAVNLEHRAWTLVLEDFIEAVGAEKARQAIMRSKLWIKARFDGEIWLLLHEQHAKDYDARVAAGLPPEGSPLAGPTPDDISRFPMLKDLKKRPRPKRRGKKSGG